MAISGDCLSTAVMTAQDLESKPIAPSVKPIRSTVRRTIVE